MNQSKKVKHAKLLVEIKFLMGLDRVTHAKLAANLQSVPLKSGEVPFREGEPGCTSTNWAQYDPAGSADAVSNGESLFPAKSRGFRGSSEGDPKTYGHSVLGKFTRLHSRVL